ncbi:MAG: VWA domain-containing protein [Pseudomonadales bacterium]
MLEAIHFVRPWWLLGVIPAVMLALLWAQRRQSTSHWESSIAPELLAVLLEPVGPRASRALPAAAGAALFAAAVALAGPSWERLPQPVEQRSDALVVVLDLSLSMFADDIAPSRIVRARQKIADVLRTRREGFTALVAYAGDAHAVVPLTDDTRTIENLLWALSPDMMPVLGSNLGSALDVAHELFENAHVNQGRVLLVTDGIDQMSDATTRRDPNFPLSVLGVGTPGGGTIPLDFVNQPGQVLRTQQGEAVVARLDVERLRNVAEAGYGRYRTLTLDDGDITELLSTPLPGEDETTAVDREFDTWADQGFWVVLVLVPLLLLAFRRGAIACVALTLVPLLAAAPSEAGVWDDLWQRRDQQGLQALQEGQPEMAATLFEDPAWRAAADYRSGAYDRAAAEFSAHDDLTATYNLGNALAQQGDFEAAVAAYDRVLAADPDHEDARFNRDLLQRALDQQQSQSQNEDQNQQQGGQNPENSAQPQGDGQTPQEQSEDEQGSPSEESEQQEQGDSEQSEAEQSAEGEQQESASSRDERKDALEQWLRRVPDDPGGLLRRKFQYETNQRLRRGEYGSRDAEKIW